MRTYSIRRHVFAKEKANILQNSLCVCGHIFLSLRSVHILISMFAVHIDHSLITTTPLHGVSSADAKVRQRSERKQPNEKLRGCTGCKNICEKLLTCQVQMFYGKKKYKNKKTWHSMVRACLRSKNVLRDGGYQIIMLHLYF